MNLYIREGLVYSSFIIDYYIAMVYSEKFYNFWYKYINDSNHMKDNIQDGYKFAELWVVYKLLCEKQSTS